MLMLHKVEELAYSKFVWPVLAELVMLQCWCPHDTLRNYTRRIYNVMARHRIVSGGCITDYNIGWAKFN